MTKVGKLLLAVMVASACAFSQQITGSIRGVISDPTGAVVQSANITARQLETGLVRTTTSDNSGNFLLLELPVGVGEVSRQSVEIAKCLRSLVP